MSGGWRGTELLEPVSAEQPSGQNLEDTPLLSSFDRYRLYGRTKPFEKPPAEEGAPKDVLEDRDQQGPPDWVELKEKSLEGLRQSRDLRLLANLGVALLRTDGLLSFLETLRVATQWLGAHWEETYPRIDEDGIARRSALNCFADPIAVIDRLRRVPIVSSRQHGVFSLRDVDMATGGIQPGRGETPPEEGQINAAFASLPIEELTELLAAVSDGLHGLKGIDARMREVGSDAAPDLDPLTAQLSKTEKVLRAQLAARPSAESAPGQAEGGAKTEAGFSGAIRTRDEAVRALEAVATFFRTNEPSSPVPLLCERARRLVSRGFLEVLEDIAPDGIKQARLIGGLKD
jgi:type VI secretion system protein ImpA